MQGGAKALRAYNEAPLPSPIHTYTSHITYAKHPSHARRAPTPRPRRPNVFTSRQRFLKRTFGAFCAISAIANIYCGSKRFEDVIHILVCVRLQSQLDQQLLLDLIHP